MVVNDDAFILEKTRHLQVHRRQAGSYRGVSDTFRTCKGKLAGRLCLAEGLCHDDLTAG